MAPVLLPPAIVRVVRHTDLTAYLGHISALRKQNLHFAKLLNDLFGLESLTWHSLPPVLELYPVFATLKLVVVNGGRSDVLRTIEDESKKCGESVASVASPGKSRLCQA